MKIKSHGNEINESWCGDDHYQYCKRCAPLTETLTPRYGAIQRSGMLPRPLNKLWFSTFVWKDCSEWYKSKRPRRPSSTDQKLVFIKTWVAWKDPEGWDSNGTLGNCPAHRPRCFNPNSRAWTGLRAADLIYEADFVSTKKLGYTVVQTGIRIWVKAVNFKAIVRWSCTYENSNVVREPLSQFWNHSRAWALDSSLDS